MSEKVLERVAEAKDTDPSELDEPLFAAVNTDSLDKIFSSTQSGPTRDEGKVRFPYAGFTVIVTAQKEVEVRERGK
ncbi:HalOD1 output domain-containing protein [Halorubrum californiense]|uniref:HalOD1 output domain-containing protein n=1 Tax=Halorubrum californiense TaxID=416585 RepID=UPI0019553318|nr:HalOD1 output domain-containing protein [Halorubrum californiense]